MPHLTIEYTKNLRPAPSFDELFGRLHTVLADLAGIKPGNCKSRAVELDQFYVGEGDARSAFVHADIRFLEGRSVAVKQDIGRAILAVLQEAFPTPAEAQDMQVTVEIRDIQRSLYFKHPEGSLTYGDSP
ncbi:MAG: 5-carboxymethyl-2-hydroxymuconate Delta-isomerase [Gemmatimonadales bacterium]|jgi:5-carboxymethyl-2-hydroxymuconate isomerase